MRAYTNKPYFPDAQKYKKYVDRIYESGWLTNNGPLVKELESRLKDYLGVKNLILFANGTLALQYAYRLLELKDKVITTPFSFVATTSSLVWEGLQPVYVDINPQSFNIEVDQIEAMIDDDISAVLPVHIFGNPCDVEIINEVAKKHQLKVIYDAAQAFGVNYKGESVLRHGDISVVSFHGTKLFHSIEGGALITDDDEMAEKARKMVNFGITGPGEIEYLGINAKMNEFEAAMGLCVLDDIHSIFDKREEISYIYRKELKDVLEFQDIHPDGEDVVGYMPVVFGSEKVLEWAVNLLIENEITPRRYFNPSLESLSYVGEQKEMPVSKDLGSRILCLPIYPDLDRETQQMVIDLIKKALE